MFDLFSDILACRDNALTRLDVRTKLLSALCALLAVLFATRPAFPLAVLAFSVAGMCALRLPLKLVLVRLLSPLGMVLVLFAMQAVLTGDTPIYTLSVFGHGLSFTREGVERGCLLGARVLGAASIMLLLSAVTPAHRIFAALRWLGLPELWVEVASLMYRYIFVLIDEAADVATAQKVRLGYVGAPRALSSLGTLAGTVLVRALDQSMRTHEAMRARGYTGLMPYGPLPRLSRTDRRILVLFPAALGLAYLVLERRVF